MISKFLFAFLAGLITVLSPCIIPILPIVLGSALKRHRMYPVYMVLGLIMTFSVLGILFGSLGSAVGISKRTLEICATFLLFVLGLIIVIKPLSIIFTTWTEKLLAFGLPAPKASDSPLQAFVVGSTLGIVWAPCAGPVLASILALATASKSIVMSFLLLFTYAMGAGIPMLIIAYGGQRALSSRRVIKQHAEGIKHVFGWILISTAVMLYYGTFKDLEALLIPYLPSFITAL